MQVITSILTQSAQKKSGLKMGDEIRLLYMLMDLSFIAHLILSQQ
jgi:hypothetical protein